MKMNKTGFIEQLQENTDLSKEQCILLNDAMEENFIIGKNNKENTINLIMDNLKVDYKKADEYYNIAISIITNNIKNKIKHPFKSQD